MLIELTNGSVFAAVRGEGKPVLVMHGGGLDHLHMLDALEPVFEQSSGWERFYIDLPGHGRSQVDDSVCSQDDVLNLISGFMDRVFRSEKCALIGESRGSYHAMALANTRPESLLGLMLIVADAMPGSTVDWRPEHRTLVNQPNELTRSASPEAAERFRRLVVQRPDILEKIERCKIPASGRADPLLAERIKAKFDFSVDLAGTNRIFEKPCLIVNGRQDAMAGYQDMMNGLERYSRATLAILDCAGHSLAWERPKLFEALTQDWLERMTDGSSSSP